MRTNSHARVISRTNVVPLPHLCHAPAKVGFFHAIADQPDRSAISRWRARGIEAAQNIGARGVVKMVGVQFTRAPKFVDQGQACLQTFTHGHGDGMIQRDHGRRMNAAPDAVESGDLRPIGLRRRLASACNAAMAACN